MSFNDKVERKLSGWTQVSQNKIRLETKGIVATIIKQNEQYLWEVKGDKVHSYGKANTEELARARAEGKIQ